MLNPRLSFAKTRLFFNCGCLDKHDDRLIAKRKQLHSLNKKCPDFKKNYMIFMFTIKVFRYNPWSYILTFFLFSLLAVTIAGNSVFAADHPWSRGSKCNLKKPNARGLYPEALLALTNLSLDHRITQALNKSTAKDNYHNVDGFVNDQEYTAAVDISVRCLNTDKIRSLLSKLAASGFAGWYRMDGTDGWHGPPHVHAVWTGAKLKPILRWQVDSWIEGRNGLGSNRKYKFWQPSDYERLKISEAVGKNGT